MRVTPDYCRLMARYNAWQNDGLMALLRDQPLEFLLAPRGAYFGSILGTLNHLLWGDQVWLARFTGADVPPGRIADSPGLTPTGAEWATQRFRTDARITSWAEEVTALDLVGVLSWHSAAAGRWVERRLDELVVHMFNHQTHHRGQVHAMLTAAGLSPQETDLFLMPAAP